VITAIGEPAYLVLAQPYSAEVWLPRWFYALAGGCLGPSEAITLCDTNVSVVQ
jgi:hypothetical protein